MDPEVTRRRFLTASAVSALTALAGCSATTPFVGKRVDGQRRIDPPTASTVSVETEAGDVTLRSGDRDDIRVQYVKQSSSLGTDISKLRLATDQSADGLRLYAEWTGDESLLSSRPTLNLDVTLPRSLGVGRVATSAGDLTLRGVSGDARLRTESGDIVAETVDGAVRAHATSGDVGLTDVAGATRASASSGDVTVTDPGSLAGASAASGDVSVDVPALAGDTEVTADSGDVTARVAADLDCELDSRAHTGDVSADGLSLAERSDGDSPVGDSLIGTLGDGGPTLRLETSSGDIRLEPLG